ncbi:hypothetical protein TrST_g10089 [Triparma strigata]|uniref:Uncharacterized protein n=1 Tax=Triparma strigata TaxID=1606541 RepID=A0A9W7A2D6_9STRA|nr:hypothetical protein TrST_g10089 [Triparma strigata]
MRVCKPELIYSLTHQPLQTCKVLHLSTIKVEHLNVGLCSSTAVTTLNLSNNNIVRIDKTELYDYCPSLYNLDLRNNSLSSLDGICEYKMFGTLNLSGNALVLPELSKLKDVHVLDLHTLNNKGIPLSSSSSSSSSRLDDQIAYRKSVLKVCPNVWAIDGHYVSKIERSNADIIVINTSENANPEPPVNSPTYAFLTRTLKNAPTKNQDSVDNHRLAHLLKHYESSAVQHNEAVREQVHKPVPARRPLPHLDVLRSISSKIIRMDVLTLLASHVVYSIPIVVLKGALTVLLIDEAGVSDAVIHDLATLPPYALTSLLYVLRDELEQQIEGKYLEGDEVDLKMLLKSIPKVCVRHIRTTEKEKYDSGVAVRCRHAVRLCQRSPYCPIVSASKQASADLEKLYTQMSPLFEAAGFGREDLSMGREEEIEFKPGKDVPSRPYRRFWSENKNLADRSVTSEATGHGSVEGMETSRIIPPHEPVRPDEDISIDLFDDYAELQNEGIQSNQTSSWRNLEGSQDHEHCNVTVGEFFEKPVVGRVGGARKPRENEPVRVFPQLYTPVVGVGENGIFAAVADWDREDDVYAQYRTGDRGEMIFERDHLVWDPRGFWSHFEVFKMLSDNDYNNQTVSLVARKTSGLHRSGFNRIGASVPLPKAFVDEVKIGTGETGSILKGGNKLQVFSADHAWDSSFVIAPPALIAAQNYATRDVENSWSKIEDAPATLVDTTVGASVVYEDEGSLTIPPNTATATAKSKRAMTATANLADGPSLIDSSIGSSSVRSRFGLGRDQLFDEFSDLMKEMGSYRNVESDKAKAVSMNSLGAFRRKSQKVDVEDMLQHIQMRKIELGQSQFSPTRFDSGGDFPEAEDGRGGENVFSLTNAPYEEAEEEKKEAPPIEYVPSGSYAKEDESVSDSLVLPTDSDANAMQLLEMQLGLVNSRSSSTASLLKKPPRKVGPRPWYTSGGKAKLMVSSSSLANLGSGAKSLARTAQAPKPFSLPKRVIPTRVKPFLHDGYDDDESVIGRGRARAHSAGNNRWAQRFGVIRGDTSQDGDGGYGGDDGSNATLNSNPPSIENLELAVAQQAKNYDQSHPKVLTVVDQKPKRGNVVTVGLELPSVRTEEEMFKDREEYSQGAQEKREAYERLRSPTSKLLAEDSLVGGDSNANSNSNSNASRGARRTGESVVSVGQKQFVPSFDDPEESKIWGNGDGDFGLLPATPARIRKSAGGVGGGLGGGRGGGRGGGGTRLQQKLDKRSRQNQIRNVSLRSETVNGW